MTHGSSVVRWQSPGALALLVGLGGLLLIGWVGGVVGLVAGATAGRRFRQMLLAAGIALLIAAGLTILEGPLTARGVYSFQQDRPLANVAAAIAGVLLLAGLAGMIMRGGHTLGRRRPAGAVAGSRTRVPTSTIVAILVAGVLGALSLRGLGDHHWDALAFALAIFLLLFANAFVWMTRGRSEYARGGPNA